MDAIRLRIDGVASHIRRGVHLKRDDGIETPDTTPTIVSAVAVEKRVSWANCKKSFRDSCLVVMPALNEEETIAAVIQDLRERGFGWNVVMQIRAIEAGLKISELPARYRPRQGGRSKISGNVIGALCAGLAILQTVVRLYFGAARARLA